MEGISIWQLIILLVILMLLFGTKKIRNMGSDLGHGIRSFKQALSGKENNKAMSLDDDNNQSIQK